MIKQELLSLEKNFQSQDERMSVIVATKNAKIKSYKGQEVFYKTEGQTLWLSTMKQKKIEKYPCDAYFPHIYDSSKFSMYVDSTKKNTLCS